jgi:hypothetical protein
VEQTGRPVDDPLENKSSAIIEQLLPVILFALVGLVIIVFIFLNREKVTPFLTGKMINNFDEIQVSDGFHTIHLENGQTWKLTYEESHDTVFSGLVRHSSAIKESKFAILTRDILVTTDDFANPELVSTRVANHKFVWISLNSNAPSGKLNLLHTLPMNEDVNQLLDSIRSGDIVTIKGWEVDRIEGWDQDGKYVGYWQDFGCNTTLVTEVIITKKDSGN